ncbi:hypothetical protein, partial [Nostoc sp.]
FLVQPDGDRSSRANPCNSLLVSFHDSRMSLIYVGCVTPKANAPPLIPGALRYAITHPTYT